MGFRCKLRVLEFFEWIEQIGLAAANTGVGEESIALELSFKLCIYDILSWCFLSHLLLQNFSLNFLNDRIKLTMLVRKAFLKSLS